MSGVSSTQDVPGNRDAALWPDLPALPSESRLCRGSRHFARRPVRSDPVNYGFLVCASKGPASYQSAVVERLRPGWEKLTHVCYSRDADYWDCARGLRF